jgi:hypothetical protein
MRKVRLLRWVMTLGSLAAVALAVANNLEGFPPAPPQLARVSLPLPSNAPAPPALAMLLSQGSPVKLAGPVYRDARSARRQGRWPKDAKRLLAMVQEAFPTLEASRRALLQPGCLPTVHNMEELSKVNHWALLKILESLLLRAMGQIQLGQLRQAYSELATLQQRLLAIQRRCAHTLLPTLIVERTLSDLLESWGYLLAVPAGDDTLQAQIWQQLAALLARPASAPKAIRAEAQLLARAIAKMPNAWPSFDKEATIAMHTQSSKRIAWLAELPYAHPMLLQKTPEERFFARIEQRSGWRTFLLVNHGGIRLLSAGLPLYRNRIALLHVMRCQEAATVALWQRELKARGRVLATTAPAPQNPFTGKPFGDELHRADRPNPCEHPLTPKRSKGAGAVKGLPPTLVVPAAH